LFYVLLTFYLYDEGVDIISGGYMNEKCNPYPEMITDECSGIRVFNIAHRIWSEGYEAGRKEVVVDEEAQEANG
jgi:hypothetical protein